MSKACVVKIDPKDPDHSAISKAAEAVRNGSLVIFPTETVYGIAANLLNDKAIESLYKVKGRPAGKPFTVHIADISMVEKMRCKMPEAALKLAKKFWPGPLTLVLKSEDGNTVGFRMPANAIALELIKLSGVPVVAPSANLSGSPAPTSAEEAAKDLSQKVDMILDGGKTHVGVESTVVDMTVSPPKVLREGAIRREELEKIWLK